MSFQQLSELARLLGLLVAAFWVAWTFHKLQRVRAAQLENEARLAALEKIRLEQEELTAKRLRQQPQLAIQLEIVEVGTPTETYRSLLCISVVLKNEGEQNLRIEFQPATLTVGRVVVQGEPELTMGVRRFAPSYFVDGSDDPQFLQERILRVGQQRRMALAVMPVTEPGCYIVQFDALYERIPFDGEAPAADVVGVPISAVEQAFVFAAGHPAAAPISKNGIDRPL
jgi:hypothetical protein